MKSMKKSFLFFLLYFLYAQNANALCAKNRIKINITAPNPVVIYDSSHTHEEFAHLTKANVQANTLGLTTATMQVGMNGKTYAQQEGNRVCIGLKTINFTLGYQSLKVYIDKKYPKNSCNYKVIKDHEDYHVAVFQQALTFFRPDIERELREAVKNLRPEYAYTETRANQIMQKQFNQIQKKIKPLLDHINRKIAEKNYAIDTPESYRKTTKLCPKW